MLPFLSSELDGRDLSVAEKSSVTSSLEPPLSPPPSSPAPLSLNKTRSQSSTFGYPSRKLDFEAVDESAKKIKRRKKRKEPIIFWKLTTLTSPNFDPNRLTSRQQMALIQKKEELLGQENSDVALKDVAKHYSPFVMDKEDDFYSHWTQELKSNKENAPNSRDLQIALKPAAKVTHRSSQALKPSEKRQNTCSPNPKTSWLAKRKSSKVYGKIIPARTELLSSTLSPVLEFQNEPSVMSLEIQPDDPLLELTELAIQSVSSVCDYQSQSRPIYPIEHALNGGIFQAQAIHQTPNYTINRLSKYQTLERNRLFQHIISITSDSCCPQLKSVDDCSVLMDRPSCCVQFDKARRLWEKLLFRQHLELKALEFSNF